MKALFIAILLTASGFGFMSFDSSINTINAQTTNKAGFKVEIKKSTTYTGKELEAVYVIKCTSLTNAKFVREFELIKSDALLKNFFMAEFVLIEKTKPTKYYPLGWESTKIKEADLKSDCLSILANDVGPVDINN